MPLTDSMIFIKVFSENYKHMCLTTRLYGIYKKRKSIQSVKQLKLKWLSDGLFIVTGQVIDTISL